MDMETETGDENLKYNMPNYEQLYRTLISGLKEHPAIWDKSHPDNKSKSAREDAYRDILLKCRAVYPSAEMDFVKTKLDSIRCCFRKEYRKVLHSKESGVDIYTPSLWYYKLMLFSIGEEVPENVPTTGKVGLWDKNTTITLINFLKHYPVLYKYDSTNNDSYNLTRKSALRKLTEDVNKATGQKYQVTYVRMKIRGLKDQYRKESRLRQKKGGTSMWCYNLLHFLRDTVSTNRTKLKRSPRIAEGTKYFQNSVKLEQLDENDVQVNHIGSQESQGDQDYDDIFDTIGKNVAHKLRDMSDDQRIYAEKVLNDLMYHGQMEELSESSALIL